MSKLFSHEFFGLKIFDKSEKKNKEEVIYSLTKGQSAPDKEITKKKSRLKKQIF